MIKTCASLALVGAVASGSWAHEFWLEPSTTRVAPGQAVSFRLFVGDGFPGEPRARNPDHLLRFEVVGPDGTTPVEGLPGEDPAGSARLSRPGIYLAVYRSKTIDIELDAARFESYLEQVGLERIQKLRAARGTSALPGRERYSRCAKALVGVPEIGDTGFDRAVGLPLELIPEDNPLLLAPGDELAVRVLLRGEALAGLTVLGFERDSGSRIRAQTDADGRVNLVLDRAGSWMISGVHMWEADGAQVDWESLWSSLTFVVGEP